MPVPPREQSTCCNSATMASATASGPSPPSSRPMGAWVCSTALPSETLEISDASESSRGRPVPRAQKSKIGRRLPQQFCQKLPVLLVRVGHQNHRIRAEHRHCTRRSGCDAGRTREAFRCGAIATGVYDYGEPSHLGGHPGKGSRIFSGTEDQQALHGQQPLDHHGSRRQLCPGTATGFQAVLGRHVP